MRLRAVTPIVVPPDELARRRRRYDALAPHGTTIHLDNLPQGPDRLETGADIRRSEEVVHVTALATDSARFDGIFLDCVLDPALESLRAEAAVPVFGMAHLVASYLGSMGMVMAAVARNRAIAAELEARIDAAGWRHRLAGVHVLDLTLEDIADADRWNRAVADRIGNLPGVDVVINGCSAVEVLAGGGPPLVDPTALALRLIGLGAPLLGSGPA